MSRSDFDFERSNKMPQKMNGMALIRTLTVSTTAFEKTKEKFYGFQQTVLRMQDFRKFAVPFFRDGKK